MTDLAELRALADAATPGPWRWQGEDWGGGWGWQMLVTADGAGLIVGQGPDGGPSEHLKGYLPVSPDLTLTGMLADGKPHVEPVHVLETVAHYIAACSPERILDLIAEVERLRAQVEGFIGYSEESGPTTQQVADTEARHAR